MRLFGLQIANGYSPEARVFASLLAHRDAQYDALVVGHSWKGGHVASQQFEQDAAVQVVRVDTGWRPNVEGRRSLGAKLVAHLTFRATLPGMAAIASRYAPDLVYSSQQRWDLHAASFVGRRLNRPQVIHLHYTVGPWLGKETLEALLVCKHVIAVSDFIRREAVGYGVPPDRVTTVRNAVSLPRAQPPTAGRAVRHELGLEPQTRLVGIVARLDATKGQRDAIDAFAGVAASDPEAHLLLVGSGPDRSSLEAYASGTNVSNRIHFLGHRGDVPYLLSALDVFIHPSRHEPFGLAIAEASAAGLPVVAYNEGGVPEIVKHGETGLLTPPGQRAGLAAALQSLLQNPELARGLGKAGRRRIEQFFTPEDAARQFTAVLSRLQDARGTASKPTRFPG